MQPSIMKCFKVLFIPLLGISISVSSRDFAKGRQDSTAGEQINDPKHTNMHTHTWRKRKHTHCCVILTAYVNHGSEHEVYWCFAHNDAPVYCTAEQERHQSARKQDQQDHLQKAVITFIKDSLAVHRDFLNSVFVLFPDV